MAGREIRPAICLVTFLWAVGLTQAQVLTPPYFNLAQGRNITATATCGVDVQPPEVYCRLTGATGNREDSSKDLIQGQLCDKCNPTIPELFHQPAYAVDGTERWWQSPPLSRGTKYNEVNLTVNLGQEFHVAYVFIKMANSPRPGVWALERSTDFGQTYKPWQYFADTAADCFKSFNMSADDPLLDDDQVLCSTEFSKVVPLENGEIVVSLVNGRPNAMNFSYSEVLQNWTKATNVQLRLIRTKTLLGHLMAVARQDPTVTRRYYYSIKDINIGGRCVCNGHANTCDRPDPNDKNKLLCSCQHNTCGPQCEFCCPGFVQKRWRQAKVDQQFECEPCQCYNHSNECVFDDEVDKQSLSIDIFGIYEGGGVCQNCQHNTMGINCDKCKPGYYRPYDVPKEDIDACQPCQCDLRFSTGECEEGDGRCKCRPEYAGENCDRCNVGYYGYPECIPCECHVNGTEGQVCTVGGGRCPCKANYDGRKCDMCAIGFYNFPECSPCDCNSLGTPSTTCELDSGQCQCLANYASRDCGQCADGYFAFPRCSYCDCDPAGTVPEICNKETGSCMCKQNYTGPRCDTCASGFFGFPGCQECRCANPGSLSPICASSGQCQCKTNYAGLNCDRCAPGYYKYPQCIPCSCNLYGSIGLTCNQTSGQCECRPNFAGLMCSKCKENFYNYPICEECNCNPDGAKEVPGYPLGGCGEVIKGQLCECKERVEGRICDTCKPGYWNLNRNNPLGCEECMCFAPGTLAGDNVCDVETGQCQCKPHAGGQNCDACLDGFYNLDADNPFGCTDCMCDPGGSISGVCNKATGQCQCKPRVTGQMCDTPIAAHFIPTLHQYQVEVEDGYTPEKEPIRYGVDSRIFPNYSWRGYAILTSLQPEVLLDVEITKPSLYTIIFRYVNRNDSPVRAQVVLTPESATDPQQSSQVVFLPTTEPLFATISSPGLGSSVVLNPGRWTVSTKADGNLFLDYFVLVPQSYYEASILQQKILRPCSVPGDPGPCVQYRYPDISQYPSVSGKDGYTIEDRKRKPVDLFPDTAILAELDSKGMFVLNPNQREVYLDLRLPDPNEYVLVVNYFNPENRTQTVVVDLNSRDGRNTGTITLQECKYSTLCRQVVKDITDMLGVFNITTGYVSLKFSGDENINVAIDSVIAIPFSEWNSGYIRPRIICIRINGVCVPSTYTTPVGSRRIDFEQPPNQDRVATDAPGYIDPRVKVVKLDEDERSIEVGTTELTPGQYVLTVQYFLPTEVGMTIPVTLYSNGKQLFGVFNANYCPTVSGCRTLIRFQEAGETVVRLTDTNVRLVFNNTQGGDIWLDYVLLTPNSQFSPAYLELRPVDKSGDFLTTCVDEGFQLKVDSEFCRHAVFTLTTEFNNGALPCNCNPDGSLTFNCDSYGGQCQCRENVIGRTCSACRPGYYGFPDCKPCNCPYGLCEPNTGECVCPPRVTGDRCERCEPQTYGFDALIGCQLCNCNPEGVANNDLNCEQQSGQCSCLPNIGGRRCDTCLPGYHSYPLCQDCNCERSGTLQAICDQTTSQCLCKDNVVGTRCDKCAEETYYLDNQNPRGCTSCFCFGTTTSCNSSSLFWDRVGDMTGWKVTALSDDRVREAGSTIAIDTRNKTKEEGEAIYWVAPQSYLGKRITSYGGRLSFTVVFSLPRDDPRENLGLVEPDVILRGSNMTVVYFHKDQPLVGTQTKVELDLQEYNFKHASSRATVTREQFMMILVNLQALHIRASYYSYIGEARLSNVQMEYGSESGFGDPALSVEQCQCPPNYRGTSCEMCAEGYYRSKTNAPYLGICVKCECNGHADTCDPKTGECLGCRDNTTGMHCDKCLSGYYGDPLTGACNICSCPLPIPSNNFAKSCVVTEDGQRTYCECQPGYFGPNCESCGPGYYGNPMVVGETCRLCQCNNNIDLTDYNSCDRQTGQCLVCQNNTAGQYCERCRDWWYGDAIRRKDCRPCTCDRCGSNSCNLQNGVCTCKPNVIGPDCDRCAPYTFGYTSCNGCESCECGAASHTPQCDLQTGQCDCKKGVMGRRCDQCRSGYWNYSSQGCQECNCRSAGAVTCDPLSGRCQCLPGVTGAQCDTCLPRWILVPGFGCQECDSCVHLLLDDVAGLEQDVVVVQRELATVSIGVAAFNKIDQYNQTVLTLQPLVQDLYLSDDDITLPTLPIQETNNALKSAEYYKGIADAVSGDAVQTAQKARDMEDQVQGAALAAQNAVSFARNVLQTILDNIQVSNIDTVISNAERIQADIESRDFTAQNQSTLVEQDEVDRVLERVRNHLERALEFVNKSDGVNEEMRVVYTALYDLQNNSRFSMNNAREALDILDRLRRIKLASLDASQETIKMVGEETADLVKMAQDLVGEARDALDGSMAAFVDVAREQSRLEDAMPALELVQTDLEKGLGDVAPLVNQSMDHAIFLQDQADTLVNMYTNTRDISANAVSAANSYKDIVDAITDAENASSAALQAGQDALLKSNGVGDDSSKSKERSMILLNASRKALSDVQDNLADRLNNAIANTTDVEKDIAALEDELGELQDNLDTLPEAVTDQTREVIDQSEVARETADDALSRVQGILAKLPDDKSKLQQIPQDKLKYDVNMQKAVSQLESVKKVTPDITNLLGSLSARSDKLSETGQILVANVNQLKERIALARDEANRIRVGLQFLGNTTVTLRNPPTLKQAGSYSKTSLYLRTESSDGLLLYIGGDQQSGRPQQDDYLALELREGRVVYTFNLGSGPARIISSRQVNDGQWHQVIAERIGKTGYLTVRTDKVEDEKVEGNSEGTFTVLELNPVTTVFYAGGAPETARLPNTLTPVKFEGGMEELEFDEEPIGLWNFISGENNYLGQRERDVMRTVVSNGFRFNGKGYVRLSARDIGLRPGKTIDVVMKFKTYAANGLMLYMTDMARDFLSLEMINGQVRFQYDLGSMRAVLISTSTYNDGEWHTVQAARQGSAGLLKVDGVEVDEGQSPGTLSELSINDDIYIGGYHMVLVPTKDVVSDNFDGCIKDVQFGAATWNLNENTQAKGVSPGCPDQVARDVSFSEDRPAFVAVASESIGNIFDITFKMKTFENESLLLYASSSAQENSFSVSIVGGLIIVMTNIGDKVTSVRSKVNTYNDGNWHYISIMKDGLKLTMNIDDYEMVDVTGEPGETNLVTSTPLYLGGLPPTIIVPSGQTPTSLRTVGCIGDVTVNKRFVNFASIKEADRLGVSLAGCPLLSPEEMEATDAPPEILPTDAAPVSTMDPNQCALPVNPEDLGEGMMNGKRFGTQASSRQEYASLPSRFRIRSEFSLEFKTLASQGMMFYMADSNHVDFIGLYMAAGKVVYSFNCGSGRAALVSPNSYNDGNWHEVTFARTKQTGTLVIDGEEVAKGKSVGHLLTINVDPPYYVGGLPEETMKKAVNNVMSGPSSLIGCIRNPKLNGRDFKAPTLEYEVKPCSDTAESGTFFSGRGGFVQLYDKFNVGLDLVIELEVKPRSKSGVLLSVHGATDYLVLQIVDGTVIFTANNGGGDITDSIALPTPTAICDGQWHSIKAEKVKNVVKLTVDGQTNAEPGVGDERSTQTDVNHPLFVGGVPDPSAKAIQTAEPFLGCIRHLTLDGRLQYLASGTSAGDVMPGSCPVN